MRVTPELRTEAIATLALPHVRIAQEWQAWPEGSLRLAFDDAYRRFARMDQGGGIVVCRVRDGREELIARLPVQAKLPVASLSISPDGRYVAFEERLKDGSVAKVSVWKVEGPSPELLLEVPEGMCERALAFHGNSQQLAIGHADSTVSVYNLATAAHVRLAVDAPPAHLAFHPRDGRLAVACGQAVKVFDVDRARELTVLPHTGIAAHVRSVAWHPDGRRLATGCYDRKIRLWDTETASEYMPPWEAPFATGDTVAFNHAGDRLVSSDSGPTALLWDVASGRLLLILPGLHGSFSTDDQIVGYSISGNSIQSWQLAAGRELRLLRNRNAGSSGYLGYMDSPIIDASGRILAANARHWLSFFDFDKGEELASVRLPREDAACPVFFDPPAPVVPSNPGEKGKEFGGWITGGRIALLLWPARFDPARPGTLCVGPPQQLASDGPNGYSMGASASKDGRVVVLPCGRGAEVLYRDRPDWRLAVEPQPDVRQAAISPDGRWIVTCTDAPDGRSKSVQIWDARPGHAETGRRVHELPMLDGSAFAKFSPDGRWLMTTTARASHLWEVGTWRPVQRFVRVHFCFSPDSRLLAINDVLSVIRLLETDTGREVTRLTGPDSAWYQPFCFSPDGTRLVTSGPGYAGLYVWDLRLIRRQLKELDLDWEWPDFAPSEGSSSIARPLKLEVDFGDLGKPTLSRAERARRKIEQYRRALAAKPDDPAGCNSLARLYATAPQPLRDVKAALPLAERAVKLAPQNAMNANTLGVVYYRAGRYREAVEVLRANLARSEDSRLVHDLYFLAMSCKKLGETERARDYYDWAVRWLRTQPNVSTNFFSQEELAEFQAEAKAVLGIKEH
jgi:WD40 repeat protein